MSKKTLIKNLNRNNDKKQTKLVCKDVLTENELANNVVDLILGKDEIIDSLYKLQDRFTYVACREPISRLCGMYQFSGTSMLEELLYDFSINNKININLRLICAKTLREFDSQEKDIKSRSYKSIDSVCSDMKDLATPLKVQIILYLIDNIKYKDKCLKYLQDIIEDFNLECEYRYKLILGLERKSENVDYFIKRCCLTFFRNEKNMTRYRILSGQYLLQKHKLSPAEKSKIEITVLSFSQDIDLDYNLRADAADVILGLGSKKNRLKAREMINELGIVDGKAITVFENRQNVHIQEIEDNVFVGLKFLSSIEIVNTDMTDTNTPKIGFFYVKNKILDYVCKKEGITTDEDKKSNKLYKTVKISLNRIHIDRALYGTYNLSLRNIIVKLWSYIVRHPKKDDITARLVEELYDTSGTCSTGYASRMVNVMSGFGDYNLTISWRQQIIANFSGRLNARARLITKEDFDTYFKLDDNYRIIIDLLVDFLNETKKKVSKRLLDIQKSLYNDENSFKKGKLLVVDITKKELSRIDDKTKLMESFQEKVILELSLKTKHDRNYREKQYFRHFFSKNMLKIREEMYEEFKEYITDTDYDLYFRQAISAYEIAEFS